MNTNDGNAKTTRGRRRRWFKIGTVFLSLLLVPLFIEAGLFIVSFIRNDRGPISFLDATRFELVIRCFGDSYTFGVGASDPSFSYPAQLEQILRQSNPSLNVRVFNHGEPGSNTSELVQKLSAQLATPPEHPTLLVVIACCNNPWNLHRCSLLLEDSPTVPFHLKWVERLERSRFGKLAVIAYGRGLPLIRHLPYLKNHEFQEPIIDVRNPEELDFMQRWLKKDYSRMADLARSKGASLVVGTYHDSWCIHEVQKIANELKIPFCPSPSPQDKIEWKNRGWVSPDGWHPNDAGYRAAAESMAQCLARLSLLENRENSFWHRLFHQSQ